MLRADAAQGGFDIVWERACKLSRKITERGMDRVDFYRAFARKVEALRASFRETVTGLKKQGKHPVMVSTDVRRPAAILQLGWRVFVDIVRSNIAVARIILLPKQKRLTSGDDPKGDDKRRAALGSGEDDK